MVAVELYRWHRVDLLLGQTMHRSLWFKTKLERLQKAVPGGSSLQVFLQSFQESDFQEHVQRFVALCAPAFKTSCADGSHPLAWTQLHAEYCELFERQLKQTLREVNLDNYHAEFCNWVQQCSKTFQAGAVVASGGVRKDELDLFIEAAASAADYDFFLTVMFAEVRKQDAATRCQPDYPQDRCKQDHCQEGYSADSSQQLPPQDQVCLTGAIRPGSTYSTLDSGPRCETFASEDLGLEETVVAPITSATFDYKPPPRPPDT